MSTKISKKTMLLVSAACLMISAFLPGTSARQCSILSVRGANNVNGAGFGVVNDGSVPRTGTSGDAGADATSFTPGPNPNPVCGSVAKIPGNKVDITSQTAKAVSSGVPLVFSNGSIPLTVFQINRDGGGPMSCEFSSDGTGKSFEPMDMTLNIPGNYGEEDANRKQYVAVATFRPGARLTGGSSGNLGLVRCRAGKQLQCGGCFVVQMNGQVVESNSGSTSAPSADMALTSQQMSMIVNKVVQMAKQANMVA